MERGWGDIVVGQVLARGVVWVRVDVVVEG